MENIVQDEKKEKVLGPYETKKEPRKSLQTYLRNQNKLLINSINIIDKKAAIMIRVNAMIISAMVIFYTEITDIHYGNYIGAIMIIASFISLLFALNSSRPHSFDTIFTINRSVKKRQLKAEERIFTPGATCDLSTDEFEVAFDKIVKSQSLQIGNQAKAMHLTENRVRISFIHIELSYLAFMLGFVATIVLFVVGNVL